MDVWTMLPLSLPSLDPRGPLRSRDPPRTTSFLPLRIATRWMEHIFPVQASSIRHASVCLKAGEVDGSLYRDVLDIGITKLLNMIYIT